MNWELVSAVIFYAIVAALIYKYRSKFTVMQKVFFVYKTQRGIDLMHKIAKLKVIWKIFSTVAIPVAFYFMFKLGQLLIDNLIGIFEGTAGAGVAIVIPGVHIPGSPIFIPFWYGIISIGILAVVHEFGHGIVASMEGIRLKSAGFGFLAILPLAFVELDEEQMAKRNVLTRLRVAASGSFANICLFAILAGFMLFAFSPFVGGLTTNTGVELSSVTPDFPAQQAGLDVGDVVVAINNQSTLDVDSFISKMGTIAPGEEITVKTLDNSYTFETTANPANESLPYLGVTVSQVYDTTAEAKSTYGILLEPIFWIYNLVFWVANLNLLIGIMNFLPIWALDGGRMVYDALGYLIKKKKVLTFVTLAIFSFYLTVLVLNIIGPWIF